MTKEQMAAIYKDAEEPMVFVARREDGTIYAYWTNPSDEATEVLPEAHPDVVAFRSDLSSRLDAVR